MFNLVEKLREKTGITYEEAKCVLEINNWDILDSILYLEEQGKVKRPSVSIFYTNEYNENYEDEDQQFNFQEVKKDNNYKSNNNFEGIFEAICKVIDTCNNIFIEIMGKNNFFFASYSSYCSFNIWILDINTSCCHWDYF